MTAKMGRPKVDNPKSTPLTVRLDAETDKKLLDYCIKHNMSKGEAVRKGIHLLLQEEIKQKSE